MKQRCLFVRARAALGRPRGLLTQLQAAYYLV